MDENLHLAERTADAEPQSDRATEDSLLSLLVETVRGLRGNGRPRDQRHVTAGKRRHTGEGRQLADGGQVEVSSEGSTVSPPGDETENEGREEGHKSIEVEWTEKELEKKVLGVLRELGVVHSDRGVDDDDDDDVQNSTEPSHSNMSVDFEKTSDSSSGSSECGYVAETRRRAEDKGQVPDNRRTSPQTQRDFLQEEMEKERERERTKGKEERNAEWITVGLTGQLKDSQSDIPDACYITAPGGVAKVMTCEVADALSSLMVIGSEELVSRVLRVKVQDGTRFHFPVIVIVPFRARYRGNYRDVVVKVVDGEKKTSYITPISTEGTYGGKRGSFAKVRVYSLGLFAVVSRLRRENYTIPRRGLSLKLPTDPRVCLDYLPGCFTAPVVAQSMIQPVDASLLATLKARSDAYYSVVSSSPLLYLTHPSSQPLRRPLTLTLPCPPNPEKKRAGKAEKSDHHNIRPISAALLKDQPNWHRVRMLSASVKSSRDMSNELLVLLGYGDKQWNVLEKVPVRNLQNGLVSFELSEDFERLLVVRLLSPVRPYHLTSLVQELEELACRHVVTIVLQRRREEPHAALVAALPSRDLSWELSKLRAQGYSGPTEPSPEISMSEGERLLLCFSGNITSTGSQNHQNGVTCEQITFHSQRKNRLLLRLTEVDPFGNYSSPHYKGTAILYKVARGQLQWQGDETVPLNMKLLGDPICKLSLTLPKKVRTVNRPVSAKVKLYEETEPLSDALLLWLSEELSEQEVALLVLSLRLRRSSAQMAKLRAGDSPSAQAFHLLALWRRGLPAAPHPARTSQLARCLDKTGRPDLARELLLRQAAVTRGGSYVELKIRP
ncbi:death domain-containing protein 1 [Polymixia lowei]